MPGLQKLHWTSGTNPRLSFGLQTVYLLRPEPRALSRSRDTVINNAVRYSEESSRIRRRIHNISVKSCEKHSNSAQNSVKATDIRTNATDVETRETMFNKQKSPPFTMDLT